MFIHRTLSSVVLFALFLGVSHGLWLTSAHAQVLDSGETRLTCPADGLPLSFLRQANERIVIDETYSDTVLLQNGPTLTYGGVQVAVALYRAGESIPAYWSVVATERTLPASASIEIPFEVDLSTVPAGEYTARAYIMQGDDGALLGAILRDGSISEGVTIVKDADQARDVSVSLQVENAASLTTGSPINVTAVTENNSAVPLLNSSLAVLVTQGEIPLGAAVRAETYDSVKLIPGSTRTTNVTDPFTESGEYTVYAALVTEGVMQPIERVTLMLDTDFEDDFARSWPYVSQIGTTAFPLDASSEVIACVNYLGAESESIETSELIGLNIEVETAEGVVATAESRSDEVETMNYFTITPGVAASNFTLNVDFLQERFLSGVTDGDGFDARSNPADTLTVVDSLTLAFTCQDDCVEGVDPTVQSYVTGDDAQSLQSFWFYAGIVIAAALLLYIMLRRLHPEEDNTGEAQPEELQ